MSAVVGQPVAAEARLPARIPEDAVRDLLLLAALWLASLLVVNPLGNFPLNDDWSFGLAAKRLVQTGDFRPTGFTSMPLISQTLWGALFCLPGGFSFNALRVSTLVMSLAGVLAVYLLVRRVHPSRLLAGTVALTLGFNPIYYALSNTFMTDAFFTALMVLAALFLSRSLDNGSDLDLVCGLAFALAATLCRQLGLAVSLAFAVCLLWRRGFAGRWLIRAALPVAICAGALLAFQYWMRVSGRLPALYSLQNEQFVAVLGTPQRLVPGMAKHIGTALLYLGWFSLPVLALTVPAFATLRANRKAWVSAACAGCLFIVGSILVLIHSRGPMPIGGNIVLPQGIGPLTLRDVHVLNLPHVPPVWKGFWWLVTSASLVGGALLVGSGVWLVANRRRFLPPLRCSAGQIQSLFLLLCGGAYLFPVLVIGGWDRYYMPALPFLLAGAAAISGGSWQRVHSDTAASGSAAFTPLHAAKCDSTVQQVDFPGARRLKRRERHAPGAVIADPRWQWPAGSRFVLAVLLVAVVSLFSVLGTRDYLAWNRVRWMALGNLLADGKVTAADVDGGFEFNGYHLYNPAYKEQPDKSWYWVERDTYVLAFGNIPGWTCVKEYAYSHWLPPYTGRLLVLRKGSP